METRAYLKGTRLSPQKAALVADQIRGKSVDQAMDFLVFNKQKGSAVIKKLLESAIANAENNNNADIDKLSISSIIVMDSSAGNLCAMAHRGDEDLNPSLCCKLKLLTLYTMPSMS